MPRNPNRGDDDVAERYVEAADSSSSGSSRRKKQPRDQPRSDPEVELSVCIPKHLHKHVIGAKGAVVQQLRDEFRCDIDVPPQQDPSEEVSIFGPESLARKAKAAVLEIAQKPTLQQAQQSTRKDSGSQRRAHVDTFVEGQESVVIHVDMEKFAHGRVVGPQRSRLEDLTKRVSDLVAGTRTSNLASVAVVVPDRNDSSSIISITVPKLHAAAAQKAVEDFITFYELLPHVRSIKAIELAAAPATSSNAVGGASNVPLASSPTVASVGQPSASSEDKGVNNSSTRGRNEKKSGQAGKSSAELTAAPSGPASGGPRQSAASASAVPQCRACHSPLTAFVDLTAANGYTHAVLPKRTISALPH
jgi:hypothetical protein